jgi:hypothetical protein
LEGKEEFTVASNLYSQIGDIRSIALMHANSEHWEDVSLSLKYFCGQLRDLGICYSGKT